MDGVHDWLRGALVGALLTACVAESDPPVPAGEGSGGTQPTALTTASADSAAIPPATPKGPARLHAQRAAADSGAPASGLGRYVVQVGAYKRRTAAAAFAADLGLMGLAAEVVSEAEIHRVRIGPFSTISEARALGDRLRRDLGLDYWVDSR